MKIRNLTSLVLSSLFLLLFIPVFYSVLFIGSEMDYNPEHKITTLWGNMPLFLLGILGLLIFILLYALLDRIPLNKYTAAGTVLFSFLTCVIFYAVKAESSKSIAFYGGWDCGMVANSARWLAQGQDIGYDDYYYIYSNNVPITWLLYILYRFSDSLPDYAYNPEFIWIQFQCILFALAVFLGAMAVFLITRKIASALLCLLASLLVLGLCPWQIIPYTDASTIAMPVLTVFLYALFRNSAWKSRYAVWFLMVFAGALGGILKATCYIALIAALLMEVLWLMSGTETVRQKLKKLGIRLLLLACAFAAALWCRSNMYKTVNYTPDYDLQMTWTNYFYNGLNQSTTGACSGDGLSIVRSYAGYSRRFRQSVELHYAKERILEMGIGGLLDFWLRKQVMNFNDGTFGWFQEGFFHAWDYEKLTDSPFLKPLRDFYWKEGAAYAKFTTWSQGLWIFILTGILFQGLLLIPSVLRQKNNTAARCIDTMTILTFLGIFLFVMLFEGRARYLLNYLPVFITIAVLGYGRAARAVLPRIKTDRLPLCGQLHAAH